MRPPVHRRKFIIYPQFQYAILAANIILLFCTFMFIFIITQNNFNYLYGLGTDLRLTSDHIYFRFLDHHAGTLFRALGLSAVITMIFSTFVTIMLSHRLAGPVVRLREHLKRYAQTGEYHPLSFRKNDFFSDLPEVVNKALETHEEKKNKPLT
jgi:hypothetical protein